MDVTRPGGAVRRLALLPMLLFAIPAAGQMRAPFGGLRCVEAGGSVTAWKRFGDVTTVEAKDLGRYVVESVDLVRRTAEFTSDAGSVEVQVVPLDESMILMDIASSGNQAFTTIFYRTREQDAYFFVHSRHTSVSGVPVISQTHGSCAILDYPYLNR